MRGQVQKARRDAGLCIDCGGPAPRNSAYLPNVARRKALETGVPFERLVTDAICGDCMDKRQAKAKKKKAKQRARRLAYQDRKERGLCGKSGCPNEPMPGYAACQSCRDGSRRRSRDRYKRLRDAGLCIHCGKSPVTEGYKSCLICRTNRRRRAREGATLSTREGLE